MSIGCYYFSFKYEIWYQKSLNENNNIKINDSLSFFERKPN